MTDYYLLIIGPDGEPVARAELDCDSDLDAVAAARNIRSPHGHALFAGSRFLGHFDPRWGEHLEEEDEDPPAPGLFSR